METSYGLRSAGNRDMEHCRSQDHALSAVNASSERSATKSDDVHNPLSVDPPETIVARAQTAMLGESVSLAAHKSSIEEASEDRTVKADVKAPSAARVVPISDNGGSWLITSLL